MGFNHEFHMNSNYKNFINIYLLEVYEDEIELVNHKEADMDRSMSFAL